MPSAQPLIGTCDNNQGWTCRLQTVNGPLGSVAPLPRDRGTMPYRHRRIGEEFPLPAAVVQDDHLGGAPKLARTKGPSTISRGDRQHVMGRSDRMPRPRQLVMPVGIRHRPHPFYRACARAAARAGQRLNSATVSRTLAIEMFRSMAARSTSPSIASARCDASHHASHPAQTRDHDGGGNEYGRVEVYAGGIICLPKDFLNENRTSI